MPRTVRTLVVLNAAERGGALCRPVEGFVETGVKPRIRDFWHFSNNHLAGNPCAAVRNHAVEGVLALVETGGDPVETAC